MDQPISFYERCTCSIYTDTYIIDGIRAELNLTALAAYLKYDWEKNDCSIVSMIPLNSADSIWVGTDLNNVYWPKAGDVIRIYHMQSNDGNRSRAE